MSQKGHFRAYGRREVPASGLIDPGETPESAALGRAGSRASPSGGGDQPSKVPARQARSSNESHSHIQTTRARKRTGEGAASRGRSDSTGESEERVRVVNLSLGGACIESSEPVVLGASLALE